MSEPTIEETIEYLINAAAIASGPIFDGKAVPLYNLAIRALEQMRERDNALHLAQTILFRMRPNWAQGPDLVFCLRGILRAMDEELPPKATSKPRTWRDVTAG